MLSTFVWRVTVGTILGVVGASLQLLTPQTAAASCATGYHYAFQGVVLNGSGGLYNPPTCGGPGYFGWTGIDGAIQVPSHFPNLHGNTNNHSAGWIGISFSNGGWVQEGWYAGCVGGWLPCRTSNLGRYTEVYNPSLNPVFYEFHDWDTAAYSSSSIYLIEYASSGCWNLYLDYNSLKKTYCNLPSSGEPEVVSEIYTADGSHVAMPTTIYGDANPYTNNGLRIKGGNGFVAWLTTLSSGQTGYYDERNGQPGCDRASCLYYYISYFNTFYHFLAYGEDT